MQAAIQASLGDVPHQHQQPLPACGVQLQAALQAPRPQQPPGAATHSEEAQMQWAVEASLLAKLHHKHGSGRRDNPMMVDSDDGDGEELVLPQGSGDHESPVDLT